ncbi:helix-turn-helix transcriptional regulator [Curvivirga aplysinae]|uniref:helix-turn-helix transcriptional regulator n=1 Tax=Curvivirga aplysinae TaxID=2529852 RepID=UPI0012BB5B9C|nr:AraC family transcriptional regulator [Curvivirga aplysinae]MTI08623.1 AraC family transcriptional regulator [Curvivirga aplysinae]
MNSVVETQIFKSRSPQKLRNVPIRFPTIIWVQKGHKELFLRDELMKLDPTNWLMTHADQYLTFLNIPEGIDFQSKCVTFKVAPPMEMLENQLSDFKMPSPIIKRQVNLDYCLEFITSDGFKNLSEAAQTQFIYGFYEVLKELNMLSMLFPTQWNTYTQKVIHLVSNNPGFDHRLDDIAQLLFMSRATLARKLDIEFTSFRKILREARMSFALTLLQKSKKPIEVALACGYKSEARFSAQFKKQFDLSPSEYARTIN